MVHIGKKFIEYFYFVIVRYIFYALLCRNQKCMECDIALQRVYVTICDFNKTTQQWKWGFVNETNVRNWLTYGPSIVDENEVESLKKVLH